MMTEYISLFKVGNRLNKEMEPHPFGDGFEVVDIFISETMSGVFVNFLYKRPVAMSGHGSYKGETYTQAVSIQHILGGEYDDLRCTVI